MTGDCAMIDEIVNNIYCLLGVRNIGKSPMIKWGIEIKKELCNSFEWVQV